MKQITLVPFLLFAALNSAHARPPAQPLAAVAILPPVISAHGQTQEYPVLGQDKFNIEDSFHRVEKRFVNESKHRRWPFQIEDEATVEAAFSGATGTAYTQKSQLPFNSLKGFADQIQARYLVQITINEETSYRKTNTLLAMASGRANINLAIYDAQSDSFVWQKEITAESSRGDYGHWGSLSARQDQALLNCMLRAIEPFAKGERMDIPRPEINVIATVKKVLEDGKRVFLDLGASSNIEAGTIFDSIESGSEIQVTSVFDNGSLAKIVKGSPHAGEIFKPASNNPAK